MKTIIIPGYSSKNKEWANEVKSHTDNSEIVEWPHWSDSTHKFHVKDEVFKLQEIIKDEDVNIIAKSIGTLVLMCYLEKNKINGKIILCGVPYNDLNENDKSSYKILSDFDPTKIIIIQNSLDEHGSFEEARRFISGYNPNIKFIEKAGSTHEYPYYEEFNKFLK